MTGDFIFGFVCGGVALLILCFCAYLWSERRYVNVREMYDGENTHG